MPSPTPTRFNWLAWRTYSPTACACSCGSGHRGNPTTSICCPGGALWRCPTCGQYVACFRPTTPGFARLYNGICSPGCPGAPIQAPQTAPAAPQPAPMTPAPHRWPDEPPAPPQPHLAAPYIRERIGSADAILSALGHDIRVPKVLPFQQSGMLDLGCPRCGDRGRVYFDEHPKLPYAGAIFNFHCKERPS